VRASPLIGSYLLEEFTQVIWSDGAKAVKARST